MVFRRLSGKHGPVAAGALGLEQRRVSSCNQFPGPFAMVREAGNADRRGDAWQRTAMME